MINRKQAEAAVQTHGTIFFDSNMNPVTPVMGMWFCEFDDEYSHDPDQLRDESLVEYLGECESKVCDNQAGEFVAYGAPMFRHRVMPENADSDRRPCGVVLIKQN